MSESRTHCHWCSNHPHMSQCSSHCIHHNTAKGSLHFQDYLARHTRVVDTQSVLQSRCDQEGMCGRKSPSGCIPADRWRSNSGQWLVGLCTPCSHWEGQRWTRKDQLQRERKRWYIIKMFCKISMLLEISDPKDLHLKPTKKYTNVGRDKQEEEFALPTQVAPSSCRV